MSVHLLGEGNLFLALWQLDRMVAEEVRERGCQRCAGALHRGQFRRKPRGAAVELAEELCWREGLCCAVCRRRTLPGSVLFLGRRVYLGIAVLPASLLEHGPTGEAGTGGAHRGTLPDRVPPRAGRARRACAL